MFFLKLTESFLLIVLFLMVYIKPFLNLVLNSNMDFSELYDKRKEHLLGGGKEKQQEQRKKGKDDCI